MLLLKHESSNKPNIIQDKYEDYKYRVYGINQIHMLFFFFD